MLSYRHSFHAGNHADVLKHSILLALLQYMGRKEKPWWYIDTHAGAGCYTLGAQQGRSQAEYLQGVARLWDADDLPEMLLTYKHAVAQFNSRQHLIFYPGSPAIARTLQRPQDRLHLFELHPTDFEQLTHVFRDDYPAVTVARKDGFLGLKALLPPPGRRAVVLIDPSYEIKDDYRQVVTALSEALRRFQTGVYMIWYPMLARQEAVRLPSRLKEIAPGDWLDVRIQVGGPDGQGWGLFGSGVFIINPPWILPDMLEQTLPWLTTRLGAADYQFDYRIA